MHFLPHSPLVFTILLSFFILLVSLISLFALRPLSFHQEQTAVRQLACDQFLRGTWKTRWLSQPLSFFLALSVTDTHTHTHTFISSFLSSCPSLSPFAHSKRTDRMWLVTQLCPPFEMAFSTTGAHYALISPLIWSVSCNKQMFTRSQQPQHHVPGMWPSQRPFLPLYFLLPLLS